MKSTLSKRVLALRIAVTTAASLALLGGTQAVWGAPDSPPQPIPTSLKTEWVIDPDVKVQDCCTGQYKYVPMRVPQYTNPPECLECHMVTQQQQQFELIEGAEDGDCSRYLR